MPKDLDIVPGAGRVLVKRLKAEERTEAGIILLDSARGDGSLGEVLATCDPYDQDGEEYEPLYPVGTLVILGKHSGTRISIDREECVIIREVDILARAIPKGEARPKLKVHD